MMTVKFFRHLQPIQPPHFETHYQDPGRFQFRTEDGRLMILSKPCQVLCVGDSDIFNLCRHQCQGLKPSGYPFRQEMTLKLAKKSVTKMCFIIGLDRKSIWQCNLESSQHRIHTLHCQFYFKCIDPMRSSLNLFSNRSKTLRRFLGRRFCIAALEIYL